MQGVGCCWVMDVQISTSGHDDNYNITGATNSMIRILDKTNAMPHLFELSELFEKCEDTADVEIWPALGINSFINTKSDVFTIFIDTECDLHSATVEYQQNHKLRPNNIFAVTAFNMQHQWPFPVINFLSHIYFTFRTNKTLTTLDAGKKPYDGCVLLGGWDYGRAMLFDRLHHHGLIDRCLINLQPRKHTYPCNFPRHYYRSLHLDTLDDTTFTKLVYSDAGWFSMIIHTDSIYSYISQQIPYRIVNSCYISIVSETEFFPDQDSTIFLTEKIAKPLIAGHPFLVYGAVGFLQYLQDVGFKTFSNWIDESYDTLSGNARATAIVDSFKNFSLQSQETKLEMLNQMQEVCLHNQRLATDPKFLLSPVVNTILNLKQFLV